MKNEGENHRNPVYNPHADRDRPAVHTIVERELGQQEAEKVKKNRIQSINVWHPIGPNPITKRPLAICDYRSIDIDKDVHPLTTRLVGSHVTAYTLSRNADGAHKWYYLSKMRSDEMFLFKTYDSKHDVTQYAFHTAFEIDSEPTPNEDQLSIELRCLILYDD